MITAMQRGSESLQRAAIGTKHNNWRFPVIANSNILSSRWRAHRLVLACCLTFAALALTLPGSRAVAKPIAGGDACSRAYDSCLRNSNLCSDPAKCRRRCDVKWLNCLRGNSKSKFGGGGGGGNWPGGAGNYPGDPSKPAGKPPVSSYPGSGPIKVFPVSGGVASPVSGGNAASVRLKTSTKYRWQSKLRRRR
jgi:hypothetical protein